MQLTLGRACLLLFIFVCSSPSGFFSVLLLFPPLSSSWPFSGFYKAKEFHARVTTGLVTTYIMWARDTSRETCAMIETVLMPLLLKRLRCFYCWNDFWKRRQWIVFLKRHRFQFKWIVSIWLLEFCNFVIKPLGKL
jgi:hypothetical protein